ncbi:MAG: hypothetical protein Q8M66_04285 [Actinomycetota bacterium]|nr:hypothetical protein [Actinomycetota bacterium]
MAEDFQRIQVLVETAERSFKGHLYKPIDNGGQRLSDYINSYGDKFLRLSDVEITERGQHYRVGDKQPFVAVAVNAITYIAPLDGE